MTDMAGLEGLSGPLLFKKNTAAQLRPGKPHLNKPQDSCNNVLWTETKVEMLVHHAQQHIWRKRNTAHLIPAVSSVVEA